MAKKSTRPESGIVIGIDIGGTKIAGGIVADGRVIKRHQLPTPHDGDRIKVLSSIRAVIDALSAGKKVSGVGIGVPGTFRGTRLVDIPNIPSLNGVDLARALRLSCPLALENDSRCFTLAEWSYGAAKGKDHVVGIILGTGVGGGILIDGKLYKGRNGDANEFGAQLFNTSAQRYSREDDWEALISGAAVMARHKAIGCRRTDPAHIWNDRDPKDARVIEETERLIAIFCKNISVALDPDIIVVGGGLSTARGLVADVSHRLRDYGCRTPVKKGILKDAGIIGAAIALNKKSE